MRKPHWGFVGAAAATTAWLVVFNGIIVTPANAATPASVWSYYVAPSDNGTTAHGLGCNQAGWDNKRNTDSFVTLDFGAQNSNGSGTYLPSTTVFWGNGSIESYAESFAGGYQSCSPQHLMFLALGTSNDGPVVDGYTGFQWGDTVQAVANYGFGNVDIWGAIDAEAGFGPYAHVSNWEWGDGTGGGFEGVANNVISNFGSADGCPQYYAQWTSDYDCSGDWYLSSNYNVSWGWAPNIANPEIYYNGCSGYANQPYIYVLFFTKYPPRRFQNEPVVQSKGLFAPVRQFDRYFFEVPELAYQRLAHGVFVFSGWEFPPGDPVFTMRSPGGRVAYQIVVK